VSQLATIQRRILQMRPDELRRKPWAGPILLELHEYLDALKELENEAASRGEVVLWGETWNGCLGPLFRGCVLAVGPNAEAA
jgi:hypothetical protein